MLAGNNLPGAFSKMAADLWDFSRRILVSLFVVCVCVFALEKLCHKTLSSYIFGEIQEFACVHISRITTTDHVTSVCKLMKSNERV